MGKNKNKSARRDISLKSADSLLDVLDEVDEHIIEATSLINIAEKRHAEKIDSERRAMHAISLQCKAARDILSLIEKSFDGPTVSKHDIETSKKLFTGCVMSCLVHFRDLKCFMSLFGECMDDKYDIYEEISKKSGHVTDFITENLSYEVREKGEK